MQSLYSDIFTTCEETDFSIPDVTIREPFDESPKTYPLIVVHEIVNIPENHGTVNGETRTRVAYQFDIQTQNCRNDEDEVLTRWGAGVLLYGELADALDSEFKLTRKGNKVTQSVAPDILSTILRVEGVLDTSGYSYRP
jgi:hypothetical protein